MQCWRSFAHAGRVVSMDALVDQLWGEHPPKTAVTSLQNFISQLRKALGMNAVVTKPPGYLLDVAPSQVDVNEFERLVREARSLEPAHAARKLEDAFELWRGSPLADFTFESFAETEIARLEELRLTALGDKSRPTSMPASPRSSCLSWRRSCTVTRCASGRVAS